MTKVCPVCGQAKSIRHGFYHWRDTKNGKPRVSRLCKLCTRARAAERYQRVMADPYTAERERKRSREYRRRRQDPENAARCALYRERVKATDAETYAQQLADSRIRQRLARGAEDTPPTSRRTKVAPYREPSKAEVVEVGPLVAYLRHRFRGWTTYEIGQMTGHAVSDRRLYGLLHDQQDMIELDTVDRFVTLGLGRPDLLEALYPTGGGLL